MQYLLNSGKILFKDIPYDSLRQFNSKGPYWKFDLFEVAAPTGDATEAAKVEPAVKQALDNDKVKKSVTNII